MDLNGSQTHLNPNPNAPMLDGDQAEKDDYLLQMHNLANDVVMDCKLVTTPRKGSKAIIKENEESKVIKPEEIKDRTLMVEQDDIENITLPQAKSERNFQKVDETHENQKLKKILELKSEPVLNLIPKPSINKENGSSVIY